jgi:hypothetical protein
MSDSHSSTNTPSKIEAEATKAEKVAAPDGNKPLEAGDSAKLLKSISKDLGEIARDARDRASRSAERANFEQAARITFDSGPNQAMAVVQQADAAVNNFKASGGMTPGQMLDLVTAVNTASQGAVRGLAIDVARAHARIDKVVARVDAAEAAAALLPKVAGHVDKIERRLLKLGLIDRGSVVANLAAGKYHTNERIVDIGAWLLTKRTLNEADFVEETNYEKEPRARWMDRLYRDTPPLTFQFVDASVRVVRRADAPNGLPTFEVLSVFDPTLHSHILLPVQEAGGTSMRLRAIRELWPDLRKGDRIPSSYNAGEAYGAVSIIQPYFPMPMLYKVCRVRMSHGPRGLAAVLATMGLQSIDHWAAQLAPEGVGIVEELLGYRGAPSLIGG